jgi:hypothetical protein
MESPALHKYDRMPQMQRGIVQSIAITLPEETSWTPKYTRRIAVSSEPLGSVRRVIGISSAVALTLLMFVAGGTLFPVLLENDGALFGFVATLFAVSVIVGVFISSLSIKSVVAVE